MHATYDQDSLEDGSTLGRISASPIVVDLPSSFTTLSVAVDSEGTITGTVVITMKSRKFTQAQSPDNNTLTIADNKPLILDSRNRFDEVILTPSGVSAPAKWELTVFSE